MKKLAKVLVALLTVGVLAVPTFAATIGDDGIANTNDTTLNIPKGITVINTDYNQSYCPNITYTFAITPSSNLGAVQDSNGIRMTVKAGIADGINSTASVVFSDTDLVSSTASTLQQELAKNIELSVDLSKFQEAGIYRYTITDTTATDDLYAAGIVRSADYDTTRELDVYIIRDSASGELAVQGYVLLDEIPPVVVADTYKTPGFVEGGDIIETHTPGQDGIDGTEDDEYTFSVGGEDTVDRYMTYNLEINKIITGNMADTTHSFPFSVNLTDAGTYFTGANVANLEASSASSLSFNLTNDGVQYVYGLSPNAVAVITETNDTGNSYQVTVGASDSQTDVVEALAPNTQFSGVTKTSGYKTLNSATDISTMPNGSTTLNFENKLDAPSTTGFLMRVLPFILLAVLMGGALVVIKKIKVNKDEQ